MQSLENLLLAYCNFLSWIMRKMLGIGIRGWLFEIITMMLFVRPCAVKMMEIKASRGEVEWPPEA